MTLKNPVRWISTFWEMAIIAFSYLRGRKLRTTLTTLAIVLGVALIFAINITLPGAFNAFKQTMQATSGAVDLSMVSVTGEAFAPDEALPKLASVQGVQAVTGVLRRQITLPTSAFGGTSKMGDAEQITLVGVDPTTAQKVRPYVIAKGRFLRPGETGAALIPAGVADLAPDFDIGSPFPLMTVNGLQTFTIVGFIADTGSLYAPQITVSLTDAQTALNQPGQINAIDIALQPGTDRNAAVDNVQKALGSDFAPSTDSNVLGLVGAMNMSFAVMNMMGLLALFLGAFVIFNTFRTVILERRRDLAMLRAIGATRRQITQMILLESVLQGLGGTILGLLLGYWLAVRVVVGFNAIISKYMQGIHFEISVNAEAFVWAVVLGVLTTLVAGYWPARAASRISPLEALRPSSVSAVRRAARWGLVVGIVIMVLSVLLLVGSTQTAGLGAIVFLIGMVIAAPGLVMPVARLFGPILTLWYAREGDLAQGNLTRQPGRVAITASTLMIGLATFVMISALVISMGVFVISMTTDTFNSDIVILPQTIAVYNSVVGANEELSKRLQSLPETDAVASLRYATSKVGGIDVQMLAIDPQNYFKFSKIDFIKGTPEEAFPALDTGRVAILNSLTASALKVDLGGNVVVQTPRGPQTYRVAAVANDILSLKIYAIYISQANLKTDFQKAEDIMLMMNLKPGADKATALKGVQGVLAKYPQFTATLTGEYRNTLIETTNGALYLFYAIAILILIPSVLGLLNTLTINVLERTREIGVVRAVGGSQKQVRRIVTAEALLLGLFGAAMGVLCGVAMSYGFITAFSAIGWVMPYAFPLLGVVAAIIIGVLLALFAAILPARNAAQLDILRALQFE